MPVLTLSMFYLGFCSRIFKKDDFWGTVEDVFDEQVSESQTRDERLKKIILNDPLRQQISWSWSLIGLVGVMLGILFVCSTFVFLPIDNVFISENSWYQGIMEASFCWALAASTTITTTTSAWLIVPQLLNLQTLLFVFVLGANSKIFQTKKRK